MPLLTGTAKDQVNGKESYICPLCGHGTNGDGLTFNPGSKDGNGLKCFGCGFSGDIIELYQQAQGVNFNTALESLSKEMGITIERETAQADFSPIGNEEPSEKEETRRRADFKRGVEYYKLCMQNLNNSADALSYLKARGISKETAELFGLGFDPQWQSPTALEEGKRPPVSARLIIPTSKSHYFARMITEPADPVEKKFAKMNEGKAGLFNEDSLYNEDPRPVFVCEGAFDALSFIEAGANALALNGTSNARLFVEHLEEKPSKKTFILALDNDTAGRKATKELRQDLKRINASFIQAYNFPPQGIKDANEYLQKNPADFFSAVGDFITKTSARPDNVADYIDNLMAKDIEAFKGGMQNRTGFAGIDMKLRGVFPGLYCLAATSSLGKTTFVHQMADYWAEHGKDVLYFSLEQSTLELVTKSLARITAKNDIKSAVTSLSIRCGQFPPQVVTAHDEYRKKIGNRMSIIEGNFSVDVNFISDYIRRYIQQTNVIPICIIDYLQIIRTDSTKERTQGTKEIVDETITALKRLSRQYGIVVFVVSSVNRGGYLTPVDFESLKESGSIEYSCDSVWGLQLQCLTDTNFINEKSIIEKREIVKKAKAENPRKIEFVCLKNRFGVSSFSANMVYYPANDLFMDEEPDTAENDFSSYKTY